MWKAALTINQAPVCHLLQPHHLFPDLTENEKLKLVFSVLDMKFVRLKTLYDIDWLSRVVEAVEAVAKSFDALVVYIDETATDDPVSKGLLKHLTSFKFMLATHFLLDVLGSLRQLNKTFQIAAFHPSAQRKVAEISSALKCCILITSLLNGAQMLASLYHQVHNGTVDIAYNEDECRQVQKDCTDFIKGILANLTAHFRIIVLDLSALPLEKHQLDYGEIDVDVFADNYSSFVNKSECKIELDTLKQCTSANFRKSKFRVPSKVSWS